MSNKPSCQHAVKNNLADTGFGRFVFLIKFVVNRYGKRLSAKQFLLPPLPFIKKNLEKWQIKPYL